MTNWAGPGEGWEPIAAGDALAWSAPTIVWSDGEGHSRRWGWIGTGPTEPEPDDDGIGGRWAASRARANALLLGGTGPAEPEPRR